MKKSPTNIGIVAIGRNEGERLVSCLKSLSDQAAPLVYVDSGSTDTSVTEARKHGAIVEELDLSIPFTAARARNAGVQALTNAGHNPDYIQFIDGDCGMEPGWLAAAKEVLDQSAELGIVTGWRSEIHRDRSIYNAMCDFEWHRPAGEIDACGGDMMVRREAFMTVGGFNPNVIAAEDDEFCIRIRKAGWKIRRLPLAMTRHDAAMTRFSEWWRRAIRTGHGFAQVGALQVPYFSRERRRAYIFGAILPAAFLYGAVAAKWLMAFVIALYVLSYIRTVAGLTKQGLPGKEALGQSLFLSISKIPNMIGMGFYTWRRFRGSALNIIEYK